MVLFVNPLTPRVKPWVIQSFLTFDSMEGTLKCDHSLESCTLPWCCLFFSSTQFVILENLSILDLAFSGVNGSSVQFLRLRVDVHFFFFFVI